MITQKPHRTYRFTTVDVFTRQQFGGNPLAVFPDATGLTDQEMQSLATELNLSETTFVLPPEQPGSTAKVRIFNRSHEMPFAGHPMVGTAFVLASQSATPPNRMKFEVPAGFVDIRIDFLENEVSGATIDAPQTLRLGRKIPAAEIAECIGVAKGEVLETHHSPCVASVGNSFVVAELGPEALTKAAPDVNAFDQVRNRYVDLDGRFSLYVYTREGRNIQARMFAPLVGTFEDPATGSAATPLVALLLDISGEAEEEFEIRQGEQMGRPSQLLARAWRDQAGIHASVGGGCVPVLRGEALLS